MLRGRPEPTGARPCSGHLLHPVDLLAGECARTGIECGRAISLADGWTAFSAVQEIGSERNTTDRYWASPAAARRFPEAMGLLTRERSPFAGVKLDRPRIVGVLNVTPDSFSDGGRYLDPVRAVDRVHQMVEEGADIIDIGGESTRPGAGPVTVREELGRVLPVIEGARRCGVPLSIDSCRAEVMKEAVVAGAEIVNDITGLSGDSQALMAIAHSQASVVLMHMQGTPETMQLAPRYEFAPVDIYRWLSRRIELCRAAGIDRSRIAVDPGIGFGKTDRHNLELLNRGALFHGLGCAVMYGVSRKSFIGRLARVSLPSDRLPGTVAATVAALLQGVQLHRVHDVREIRQALDVWWALMESG